MKDKEEIDLYIVRGIPGAGKTTFAKKMLQASGLAEEHFEADMFFERNGKYEFNPDKLPDAHRWCINQVRKALSSGKKVVVSNTFTRIFEMQPYFDLCKELGKTFKVIRLTTDFGSIHNVSSESIARMKARFQDYCGEILIK